jgi:hypothetical protein
MKQRLQALFIVVLGGLVVAPAYVRAQEAATVTCKDGSTSKGGKGACSHHGGVAKGEAAPQTTNAVVPPSPQHVPPQPPPTHAAPPHPAPAPAPAPTHTSTPPPVNNTGKPTATCKDGSTSYSVHHSGACSHHGGVKQWLDGTQ